MKITDLSILCKWDNLTNRQCIKYLFAPLVYILHGCIGYITAGQTSLVGIKGKKPQSDTQIALVCCYIDSG